MSEKTPEKIVGLISKEPSIAKLEAGIIELLQLEGYQHVSGETIACAENEIENGVARTFGFAKYLTALLNAGADPFVSDDHATIISWEGDLCEGYFLNRSAAYGLCRDGCGGRRLRA